MSATSSPRASPMQFRQRDDDFTLDPIGFGANFTLDTIGDGASLPPRALSDAPGLVVYEYFVGEPVAVGTAAADVDWNDPAYTGEPPQTVGVEPDSDSVHRSPRTTVERLGSLQDLLESLRATEARTGAAGLAAPDAGAGNLSKVKDEFLHPTGAYQRILEFTAADAARTKENLEEFLAEFVVKYLGYPGVKMPPSSFDGVLARGKFAQDPTNDRSVVLVSLPYLCTTARKPADDGSAGAQATSEPESRQIYFVVIDDATLAIFRQTADATAATNDPLLLPGQSRLGAFQTLMSLVARLVGSATNIRDMLEDRARAHDAELAQHKLAILRSHSEEERMDLVHTAKTLLADVYKGLRDVSVLARVAVSQVRVLKQLRKLLGNSTPLVSEGWKRWPHPGSRRYVADVVRVPTVRMLLEQLPLVLWMIDETVDECKQLAHAVQDLQAPVRVSCDSLALLVATSASAEEAVLQAQKVADEIAWQGETMSMFTAVTTLFLPLSFFTSYFALDDAKRVINTQEQFWAVSGPVTAVFVVATIIIVLGKEYPYSELLHAVFTFTKPKSRQKRHQEEFDKNRAKLMDLKAEGDPPAAVAKQPSTRLSNRRSHPTSSVSTTGKVE